MASRGVVGWVVVAVWVFTGFSYPWSVVIGAELRRANSATVSRLCRALPGRVFVLAVPGHLGGEMIGYLVRHLGEMIGHLVRLVRPGPGSPCGLPWWAWAAR